MHNDLTDILSLIPQRPPFVFVSRVLSVTESQAQTEYLVSADCPLVDEGELSCAGLLEHAAQTCAVHAGWVQQSRRQPVRIGYIGAVKEQTVARLPRVGEIVCTQATVLEEVMHISLIECVSRVGEETISHLILKLALDE